MNKILAIFALLLVFIPISIADSDYLYNGWVTTGDSFEVGGNTYLTSQGETATSAIIMGPEGIFVLGEGECINREKLRWCVEEFKYTIGGNVTIHGSDTQDFYITVSEPGADLEIDRSIDESNIMVGESATVIINIINNGDEAAVSMAYTETVPSEFEIINTYNFEQLGNKLTWRGAVPAHSKVDMSYKIKAKQKWSGQVPGTLTYKSGDNQKEMTDSLGFKSSSMFNINFDTDNFEVELGEKTRFYVILENIRNTEASYSMVITVPESMEILDSHINDTDGNKLLWGEKLKSDEEIRLTTAVKAIKSGISTITITVIDKSDPYNPTTKTLNITVGGIEPKITFIHNDLYVNETAQIKLYLKNPSTFLTMTDLDAVINSTLFNEHGSDPKFNPKEYNPIVTAEFIPDVAGNIEVNAEVTYKIEGTSYIVRKTEVITVKERVEESAEPEINQTEEPEPETTPDGEKIAEKVSSWQKTINFIDKLFNYVYFWR